MVARNSFNQPAFDARLYGQAIGGTPIGVAIDLRARQTTTTSAGVQTVDGHTRAYQAVLFWNAPDARFRAAAARQYLATVSSIGLFDGGLVELNGSHLTVGGFLGWEPDPSTLAFSSSVHDVGGYVTMHNRPGSTTATAFTLGAVGSYQGSTERREWALAQANVEQPVPLALRAPGSGLLPALEARGPQRRTEPCVVDEPVRERLRPSEVVALDQRHLRQTPQRAARAGLHEPGDELRRRLPRKLR